jgi:hypothetical protein
MNRWYLFVAVALLLLFAWGVRLAHLSERVTAVLIVAVFFLVLIKPEAAKRLVETEIHTSLGMAKPVWVYRLLGAFGFALGLLVL